MNPSLQLTKEEIGGPRVGVIDEKSESAWDRISGRAMGGKLRGQRLPEVSATTGLWLAWYAFNPETKMLKP